MATSGGDPQRRKATSLPGGSIGSRGGSQPAVVRPEKKLWSSFPAALRLVNSYKASTSSFLLQHIIHRYPESDPELEESEDEGEGVGVNEERMDSEASSESELLNLEGEFDGVLREEAVAEALYQLGRSGSGTEQVFLNLTLSGSDLIDISILCGYVHLQKLDLSVNKIGDLSCVSCMPYLLELNASQNKLTSFFNFKPPKNLKKVDFSFNQISKMADLSAYQALTKLILDRYIGNAIEEIRGLELCSSLTHLSLAKNKITTISGLGELPIKILCLSHNLLEKIMGLDRLRALKIVDLSHNQIKSLQGLENHDFLEVINLEDNKIAELGEIEYIENLPLLRILNLLKNPIQEHCEYWLFVIFMLLQLTELDQKKITVEEKVFAVNKYNPPPEVVAAQDHLTHVVHSVMQPQRIFDSTLPSLDAPYPMLVLAGPEDCGKRELAHRLCRQFSTYFRYGACHTTRPPYFGEGDRVDYQFISEEVFNKMVHMGKFILTFNYNDHSYGLSRDTIEGIARDGLASCVHMEIEGVRSLKLSHFEPRYILVLPLNKKKYEGHLRRKGLFSRVEIEFAVSRVDHYIKINQKSPGFFDAVINADDLDAAYHQLSQLVQEYLGLGQDTAIGLAPPAGDPSNKKTPSGVPAHLVPSPRRLAKLQADGLAAERLSGGQVPENQNRELSPGGATPQGEPSPRGHIGAEAPAQPGSSALSIPPEAQAASPNQKEGDAPQSALSSTRTTTNPPENEAGTSEPVAGEGGQRPPRLPDPPPAPSPPQDQNEESGEVEVTPTDPPSPEPPQGPGPTPLSPQRSQAEETESANLPPGSSHHDPPGQPSDPEGALMLQPSLGESQHPLEEGTPEVEVRVSTPFPEPPPPQDPGISKQPQDRGDPVALLSKSRLAPSRLPRPQVLAPLQSPRPSLRLPSPRATADQPRTPSPKPPAAQEGDPGKLPLISPPNSKPPSHLSPHPGHSPQHVQEESIREVKLPLISPPTQEHPPQPAPDLPQEEEAPGVRLPRLPTPLPQNRGARHQARPAKERQAPQGGRSSSKKIPDMQASPPNQEPVQQAVARKKKLPAQRGTARGPAHLTEVPPASHLTALQPESQSRPTGPETAAAAPNPSPPQSPQRSQKSRAHPPGIPEPPHAEPVPGDPGLQEQERGKVQHSRKKAHANLPPNDLVQKVATSTKGPSSKRERAGGLSQDKTTLGSDRPTREGPLAHERAPRHAESTVGGPASAGRPRRKEEAHHRGRSWKGEPASDLLEQDVSAPTPQPAPGTSETREGSVQGDDASRQQTNERNTPKHEGASHDRSPAAPQNPVSAEEQGGRQERLRARGSQSTKV